MRDYAEFIENPFRNPLAFFQEFVFKIVLEIIIRKIFSEIHSSIFSRISLAIVSKTHQKFDRPIQLEQHTRKYSLKKLQKQRLLD